VERRIAPLTSGHNATKSNGVKSNRHSTHVTLTFDLRPWYSISV